MTTTSDEARAPQEIKGVQGLLDRLGTDLGTSSWREVKQEDVTTFATLTGDDQWIHVDPERAKSGPFGTTIQHGFLTLSLSTGFIYELFTVTDVSMILNYGLNKVRFPSPLLVGSRVRMHVKLAEVEEIKGGVQTVFGLTFEVEGQAKPCCVADLVFRYYS